PRGRLALRSLRHQRQADPARREPQRGHRLAGRLPPGPRPRGRPLPGRQRHRRRPAALPTLRGQRRLAAHPGHRLRPDRLATPARLRRCPGPCRTGHPAVPHLPHPGHPHPRRAPTPTQLPTRPALDSPPPADLPTPLPPPLPPLPPPTPPRPPHPPPARPPHTPARRRPPPEATLGHYRHATTRKPPLRHDQSSTHINMSKIVKRRGIARHRAVLVPLAVGLA